MTNDKRQMTTHAIRPFSTNLGLPAGASAAVDPFDQHDAAPSRPLGRHGVLAGQLQEAPHVDLAQTAFALAGANGGSGTRRGDAGTAQDPRSMACHFWRTRDASLRRA